jgi:SAM-dependent methyltransferase
MFPPSRDDYAITADLYDYVVPYANRPDVAFYVNQAKSAGGPVLELGCGTGRVLIPTARAGLEITGIDASPRMLGICRHRLGAEPPEIQSRVRLIEADMRSFDLGRRFVLATIPFRPFQHLITVEDQLACLTAIRRHLCENGRLVFDLFNPSLDLLVNHPLGVETNHEPEFITPDGRAVVRCYRAVAQDRFQQTGLHELIYDISHPDGRKERLVHAFTLRYLFRFEVEHLLARAGFAVEHLYSDYAGNPYGVEYPGDLIFVAKTIPLQTNNL